MLLFLKIQTLNYTIIPDLAYEQGRVIKIDKEANKIHLSKMNVVPKESPFKKISKPDTEEMSVSENFCSQQDVEFCEIEKVENEDPILSELVALLPGAIETLRNDGKLDEYAAFTRLLNERKVPMDNIAFILFMDVVRWFSL